MLPPVLEIFVIWHPADNSGREVAQEIITHFRGQSFSGVIGGGIQVSVRSAAWGLQVDAPRPCYTHSSSGPNGLQPAKFVAFVPVVGMDMAVSVEDTSSAWFSYIKTLVSQNVSSPEHIAIFPTLLDEGVFDKTKIGKLLGKYQCVGASDPDKTGESKRSLRLRDLSQGLAQFMGSSAIEDRVTIFISHTKRSSVYEGHDVEDLVRIVRDVIAQTRLAEYFDASDLQPGTDWDQELRTNASRSALLAIRTDLYSSREWCQREIAIAKRAGIPVVTLDAMTLGEERGSFLMDHVPRLPIRKNDKGWGKNGIVAALNLLTDECLKRVIWFHQQSLTESAGDMKVSWWAPHAPELLTLLSWIEENIRANGSEGESETLMILHPDPPLGPEERVTLEKLTTLAFPLREVDIMTPRTLAARGGS